MNKIERELQKLNILSSISDCFLCGFIIIDEEDKDTINFLKKNTPNNMTFISNCNNLETLNEILNDRIKKGEKIILHNLKPIYKLFGTTNPNNDGIYNFYQKITEIYRDKLWKNNNGGLFFVLNKEEYEQFFYPKDVIEKVVYLDEVVEKRYPRDNHFRTMLTITINLTKESIKKKKIKN